MPNLGLEKQVEGYTNEWQSWIFTGRIDADAEAPVLWPPDVKSQLFGKFPDARKDWGQEEKGVTEDEMVGWHHWHWTVASQAPLSMEFSRQEYWSGLPFPFPGNLPNPGIKSMSLKSPKLAGGFFTKAPPGKPYRASSSHQRKHKRIISYSWFHEELP